MTSGGGGADSSVYPSGAPIDRLGADIAGGAGTVLDDDRLAPFTRQPITDDARNGVRRAAGRERHDDLHRAVRIVFGAGRAAKG